MPERKRITKIRKVRNSNFFTELGEIHAYHFNYDSNALYLFI
jgi:hypothetical protein